MFSFESSSSSNNLESFLGNILNRDLKSVLAKYGEMGVSALASATPVDSGLTASSWTYEIVQNGSSSSIIWSNTNVVNGTPVAVLIQMGHGTGTGGYVEGRDFINPAIQPIFDTIAENAWKAVTNE